MRPENLVKAKSKAGLRGPAGRFLRNTHPLLYPVGLLNWKGEQKSWLLGNLRENQQVACPE